MKTFVQERSATVRFAGDSGDGMQVAGSQFADIASMTGAFVRTLPDVPSEIRAPAGSLGGVSGFQISFGDEEVLTPGDSPYVLIAMNPAALKVNLPDLQPGGIIIVNEDEFTPENLGKAGYESNPLSDDRLSEYRVIPVAMTTMNDQAVAPHQLPRKDAARCRNFFALGLTLWLYDRPLQPMLEWLMGKFRSNRAVMGANGASLRAGHNFAETAELFRVQHSVAAAHLPRGRYRRVTGNEAAALGLIAAAQRAGRTLVYASYPITPASEILHELSKHKEFDVRTLQTEDEIAACVAAIGASFAGAIGVTGTSGPGLSLKTEGLGLAVMTELPMVCIDVQRAGPSTGMPTKTEQADLLMAMYGRHGESPMVVLAAATPADCFKMAFEAVRLAITYMTPVMLLSDSFLANSAEPWRIVAAEELPDLRVRELPANEEFAPYRRDPVTLARPWVAPGTPGREHRIGGLEKTDVTGVVSYDAANHQRMVDLRARKIEGISRDIPPVEVTGPSEGDLLVIGWGSTYGAIAAAVNEEQHAGRSVAHAHLRYLNPMPGEPGVRPLELPAHPGSREQQRSPALDAPRPVPRGRHRLPEGGGPPVSHQGNPGPHRDPAGREQHMSTSAPLYCTADRSEGPVPLLTKKDFQSSQEVKWCPGCGAYGILSQVQKVLPRLGIPREKTVFVSGIGCSSRFPYYLNTYGVHGIHGRAPAIAMGVKCARPDLSVWVVSGDGDGLSIGTNHLIHALRRNLDINILLLNNQIYGMTKGQYSPTSEFGKKTKSSPLGSIEQPIHPIEIALAAEATFVARAVVADLAHLGTVIEAAARHKGSSFVEIRENCVVFNDSVLQSFSDTSRRGDSWIYLEQGKPVRFGAHGNKGIVVRGMEPEVAVVGENGVREEDLLVHDATGASSAQAYLLAGLHEPAYPTAIGIFRQVERPTYDTLLMSQVDGAVAKSGRGDLAKLLNAGTTWDVD